MISGFLIIFGIFLKAEGLPQELAKGRPEGDLSASNYNNDTAAKDKCSSSSSTAVTDVGRHSALLGLLKMAPLALAI